MRPRRSYYFLAVVFLPLLVVLQNPSISEPLHGYSLAALKPAFQVGEFVSSLVTNTRETVVHFWKTFRDQGEKEERIAELESQIIGLEELTKENERLRKLIEFRQTVPQKSIAARVIGWDPSPWRRTLLLDKGDRNKIKKDMAVVVAQGLLGRIFEVGPTTARAILLTDPDSRVSALASTSRAQGVVAGDGTAQMRMLYLELNSGVAVNETVVSSGVGGLYPKGIPIGKITSLERDSDGLHLAATVEPFVSSSKLEEVLCLVPAKQK